MLMKRAIKEILRKQMLECLGEGSPFDFHVFQGTQLIFPQSILFAQPLKAGGRDYSAAFLGWVPGLG